MDTRIDEIAPDLYRFSTFVPEIAPPAGFTFNQFLLLAEEPLLFHCGQRQLFPTVSAAVARVLPLERLRWLSFGHVEADECGAMNLWLAAAPRAQVAHGQLACMVSLNDLADRPPRALADGEVLRTGQHAFKWLDAPHVPHGWECGFMMELQTRTLLCGDLFTQGGAGAVALTEGDILGPSEAFRLQMDYYAHTPRTAATLERIAREQPEVLACMHGSAWRGDGAALLRALARSLARPAGANVVVPDDEAAVV